MTTLSNSNLNRRRLAFDIQRADDDLSNGSLSRTSTPELAGMQWPAFRRWLYLGSWVLHLMLMTVVFVCVSLNMLRYLKASNGKELVKVIRNAMGVRFSQRLLSPADETQLQAEYDMHHHHSHPLPPTYDVSISGTTVFIYCATAIPFGLMGILVILSSTLRCEAAWAPEVFRVKQAVIRWFSRPLHPSKYWAAKCGGVSKAEALLYAWSCGLQICYLAHAGQAKESRWGSKHVHSVGTLPSCNHAQYTMYWFAKALGVLFSFQGAFLFVPTARGSLLHSFLGLPYGQLIKWHRWMGWQVIGTLFFHGILMQVVWMSSSFRLWISEVFRWEISKGVSNLAGLLAWLALMGMMCTVMPVVRRLHYRIFYHAHIIGALLFVVFSAIHKPVNVEWCAAGLLMYGIDVAYRLLQSSEQVDISVFADKGSSVLSILVPCQGSVSYGDSSHVWINVPEIARLCFHPFTITTCSTADSRWNKCFMLQCKIAGKWTQALADLAESRRPICARIQGPYGGEVLDTAAQAQYSRMLYITGGTGLSSVLAALQRFALQRAFVVAGNLPPVTLVHCVRDQSELQMLAPLISSADILNLRIYYTGSTALREAKYTNPPPLSGTSTPPINGETSMEQPRSTQQLQPRFHHVWELAAVWALAFLLLFWLMALPDIVVHNSNRVQLGIQGPDKMKLAYLTALVALLATLVAPLLIVAPLRTLIQTIAARSADLREDHIALMDMDDRDTSGELTTQTYPLLRPWADNAESVTIHISDDGTATIRSLVPDCMDVIIRKGRPDLAVLAAEFRSFGESKSSVGVWAAGPETMNLAVHKVFSDGIGRDIDFHVPTSQL